MDPKTNQPRASGSPISPTGSSRLYWLALGLTVAAGGAVRFACLFNDLWLDEIWTLQLLEPLKSPVQIMTGVLHDNNHPLNSLFLYFLMPTQALWTYRLLSWVAGTATLALAALIGRRQYQLLHPTAAPGKSWAAALITATLFDGCYLLINYSSEARGYAPALGFGLLAFYALLHTSENRAARWPVIYGGACVLGLLAHFVMFQVIVAGVVWSGIQVARQPGGWRKRVQHLAAWHLVPLLFLATYYVTFISKLEIGGGPRNTLPFVLGILAAYTQGFPAAAGLLVALPVLLAGIFVALGLMGRRDLRLGGFYITVIFIASGLGLSSGHFVLLFPRYFLVSATGALLLLGYALGRLWNFRSVIGRAACVLVLAAFLVGNSIPTRQLLRYGRGQYQQALRYIGENTPTVNLTLSGDSDIRNIYIIRYYMKALGPTHQLRYFLGNELPPKGPQWLLLPRVEGEVPPADGVLQVENMRFEREKIYPHAPLSGWDWYLYRNLDPTVLPPLPR